MRKTRMLIDGNNMAYRMLHTHGTLRTPKGIPTGVLYGTLNALKSLINAYSPSEVLFAWDSRGSWRKDNLFAEYKSKRHERVRSPEEEARYDEFFKVELPLVKRALSGLGIPQMEMQGLEADDLILGVVKYLYHTEIENLIVSTDKDFVQMVQWPTTRVLNPTTDKVYQRDDRRKSVMYGADEIAPCGVSYLARRMLIGDASDSIPGVRGIGEKRAAAHLNIPVHAHGLGWDTRQDNYDILREYIVKQHSMLKRGAVIDNLNIAIRDGTLRRNYDLMSLLDVPKERVALMGYVSQRAYFLRISTLYLRNCHKNMPQYGDLLSYDYAKKRSMSNMMFNKFSRFFGALGFRWALLGDSSLQMQAMYGELSLARNAHVFPLVRETIQQYRRLPE